MHYSNLFTVKARQISKMLDYIYCLCHYTFDLDRIIVYIMEKNNEIKWKTKAVLTALGLGAVTGIGIGWTANDATSKDCEVHATTAVIEKPEELGSGLANDGDGAASAVYNSLVDAGLSTANFPNTQQLVTVVGNKLNNGGMNPGDKVTILRIGECAVFTRRTTNGEITASYGVSFTPNT